MNSLRVARAALRARPTAMRVAIQRRGYAEAVPDKVRMLRILESKSMYEFCVMGIRVLPTMRSDWAGVEEMRRSMDVLDANYRNASQSIYKSQDVVQVNIPAESGEMGVLANHVPSIEQLKPGLVEVVEESGPAKQFFLSGGFASVQPNSVMSINAPEAYPLEDFSAEAIRAGIAEAQKVASGNGSEQDIAEAKIELEILETLAAHVK
ncbi:f1f0 atp synthase delta chain mitochondrial precursor [Trichoderma arundinaceum]|uniref:ATP synthase subunit delta, mitochondrial n=1 Tax=Trichoderma arundinaceum TaxID=490622 RepID=A0A395N8G6_TRIAR|nr:f1f0 atp synthase delta chain mitochondrial precursor [Trichoderma arundinaceum]